MTKKLYWVDGYLKEFSAKVVKINGNKVVLDQTIFYPKGGGIPADQGEINGIKVNDTISEAGNIFHVLEKEPNFKVGSVVKCKLDWNRRYMIMRMHTAAHVLSGVFFKEGGLLITGNQIDVNKSRMDFNMENFDRDKIQEYCDKANEIIQKDLPVEIYFMKREEALKIPGMVKLAGVLPPAVKELRIVDIVGFDKQPDGGVHVKSLKEIGKIVLTKFENKGKNNRRLYYILQ